MDGSILVDQPKQMLERSKRAVAARYILNNLAGTKFIPINSSCSLSHKALLRLIAVTTDNQRHLGKKRKAPAGGLLSSLAEK
jgi:hypothetical protein